MVCLLGCCFKAQGAGESTARERLHWKPALVKYWRVSWAVVQKRKVWGFRSYGEGSKWSSEYYRGWNTVHVIWFSIVILFFLFLPIYFFSYIFPPLFLLVVLFHCRMFWFRYPTYTRIILIHNCTVSWYFSICKSCINTYHICEISRFHHSVFDVFAPLWLLDPWKWDRRIIPNSRYPTTIR
jgi:hypothetical protein